MTKKSYRWQTELNEPERIAEVYEQSLKNFFSDFPSFDLVLLGMGNDGHTASLFPFTKALHETEKIAVANSVEKLATIRMTLTFPVINNSQNVIFLIKGADKAETLQKFYKANCSRINFHRKMLNRITAICFG